MGTPPSRQVARRTLAATFEKNMRALHDRLARARQDGTAADRLVERLAILLRRVARRQVEISFGVKRPRGRPTDDRPTTPHLPKKRGRKLKYTPAMQEQWCAELDRLIATAAADSRRITNDRAVRLHMRKRFADEFIADGTRPTEARRLAEEKARTLEASPGFPKLIKRLRERLSRVRRRARSTAR